LQSVAEYLNLRDLPTFSKEKNNWYGHRSYSAPRRDNPFIEFELNKCILCTRCIRVCDEVRNRGVYSLIQRGFNAEVSTAFGLPLQDTNCEFCGACVDVCPTAAIMDKNSKWAGFADREVITTCGYCGVGCGLKLKIKNEKIVGVVPQKDSPVNKGQDCVKGRYGTDFIYASDRLQTPMIKRNGKFESVTWGEALEYIAERFTEYKGDQFATVASGRCTNEDNYVLQKFTRAVMGTNNIDHCARL